MKSVFSEKTVFSELCGVWKSEDTGFKIQILFSANLAWNVLFNLEKLILMENKCSL